MSEMELRLEAMAYLSYAVTVKERNTSAWMDEFIKRSTKLARLLGENGEFVKPGDLIEWRDA